MYSQGFGGKFWDVDIGNSGDVTNVKKGNEVEKPFHPPK
jgi:hypothetical protein